MEYVYIEYVYSKLEVWLLVLEKCNNKSRAIAIVLNSVSVSDIAI